jgi:hypothetical protein
LKLGNFPVFFVIFVLLCFAAKRGNRESRQARRHARLRTVASIEFQSSTDFDQGRYNKSTLLIEIAALCLAQHTRQELAMR